MNRSLAEKRFKTICPEKLNKNHTSFLFIAEMTNTNGIQSQQTHSK